MSETKTLDDLCGEHLLSGVDFESVDVKDWGDRWVTANACRFCLDGVTYAAAEDEDDGYRSHMRDLIVVSGEPMNTWPAVRVLCRKAEPGRYATGADILEVIDLATSKTVLRVGTDNTDDYYPFYVAEFTPENLAHNAGAEG